MRERFESRSVEIAFIDFHVRVKVPLIPPMPAASGLREALFFRFGDFWIAVGRGKDDFFAVTGKEAARRTSATRADASPFAFVESLNVDLIEGIAHRIRLIADQLPVRREVAFAGARKTERHLSQ